MILWRRRARKYDSVPASKPIPAIVPHGVGRRSTVYTEKRDNFKKDVIAVTGSCGKTTTVAMIHDVLATTYTLHKPLPDANGTGGISNAIQTLYKSTDDMWLSEVALYREGGMKCILDILKPTVKILTNLCNVHSTEFPSTENY